MLKRWLTAATVPIVIVMFACGGPGSTPDPGATELFPAPPPVTPTARALSYFEGTADLAKKEIHVVYRAPSGEIQLEATLPTGTGANQITLHTVSTSWDGSTNVLTGQVSAINHYAGTVTGLTSKVDSITPSTVTSDAPWVYGTLAAGATSSVIAWHFTDPTGANFKFQGHVEGNAPGAAPCGQAGQKCAFVTSGTVAGGFGGVAGADTICQTAANGQGLGGTFKAWVSDPSGSPSTGFTHPAVPYKLLDGSTVASSWSALTSGTLARAINVTELGAAAGGTTSVWTNTNADGTSAAGATCTAWTSNTRPFGGAPLRPQQSMRMLTPGEPTAESAPRSESNQVSSLHLTYYGGRVVSNVQVVEVLWGAGSYLSNISSTTAPSIASFFQQVTNSAYFDWLTEYDTTTQSGTHTNQTIGHGSFASNVTITPSVSGSTISDAQIQSEIATQLAAGHLPAPTADAAGNNNTYYAIFFPPGITITQGGSNSCQSGGFCAYHGTIANANGHEVYYGVHPDMQSGSGCFTGCGTGTVFANYQSVASHELVEMVTDAEVGLAVSFAPPLGWYNGANGEIGDICNAQQGTILGGDGRTYTVQKEYSNLEDRCIVTRADFSIAAAPTPQTVNAGSTVAYTVSTALTTGLTQTIALSVTGLPGGVTGSFSPTSVAPGGSSTLTLTASAGAATSGPTTFTVTGTGPYATHTASPVVSVQGAAPANDYSVAVTPSSNTVNDGSTVAYTVNTAVTSGSAQTIALSVSGLPAGVTGSFSPASVTAGTSSTLTLTATSSAAAATATFTVTGTATSGSHGATASVTVSGPNMGAVGVDSATTSAWTQSTTQQCSVQAHLYCFEQ